MSYIADDRVQHIYIDYIIEMWALCYFLFNNRMGTVVLLWGPGGNPWESFKI